MRQTAGHRSPRLTRHRLTRAGWVFAGIALLLGIGADQSQVALLFLMFGTMLGAVAVSLVMAGRMVSAVAVSRDIPDRAWQNQTVHLAYRLRNKRSRGVALAISVTEVAADGVDSAGGYCAHVPPRGVFQAGGRFIANRRGRISLAAVEVSTRFPFGLTVARRTTQAQRSLIVWPALGKLKRRLLTGGAVETSSAAPSSVIGGQDEFFGLREYRLGDSPRWIHWRRSATRATPVLREMAKPLPDILWLIVDTYQPSRSRHVEDRLEKLLRFSATLIDHALSRGFRVGLALADSEGPRAIPAAEGRAQRTDLLDALADVDVNTTVRLDRTLAALRRDQLRQSRVIIAAPSSDALAAAGWSAVRSACRNLTLITEQNIADVFEDDPLSVSEEIIAF